MRRTIFDADHEAFRDSVRRFVAREVAPHVDRWRADGCVDRDLWRKAGAAGLLCVWADERHGGAGLDDFRYDQVIAEEIVAGGDPGFYAALHSRIVAPYIGRHGSAAQQARWLPGAVRGDLVLAIAMTEPGTGSDLAAIQTRAEDRGDHWLLQGSKTYISNGLLADVVVVAARTEGGAGPGLSLLVVERGMPGFERGRKLAKLGLDAQDTAELFFHGVRVPKDHLLGEPGQGFRLLATHLAEERLLCAVQSIAHARAAFDLTLAFVQSRQAFGRPVGQFQANRFTLAELHAQLAMQQTWVDQLVLQHNAGALDAVTAASAKLLATECEHRVIDACLQLHGGAGYMDEYRIARMYRDARVSRIFAGSNEIMKEIIGRALGLDERPPRSAADGTRRG